MTVCLTAIKDELLLETVICDQLLHWVLVVSSLIPNQTSRNFTMAMSAPPPLELDPKEVLAHLNYLGYHHITGHQLKDFMKDLKKLIRYDQLKSKENAAPAPPTSHHKRKSCHRSLSREKQNKRGSENRSSSVSSTSNLTKSNSSSNDDFQQKPLRPIQAKAKPCSATTLSSAPTFIRPWQMRSSSQIHKAGTSSDPVALYQHYKELWKLQPLPGEKNRSELRWQIREKMLACNPPPRLPLVKSKKS